jgi:hypothetical protein
MTDRQIAEIYALARESFAGGQHAIQMQALPFHLTARNLAKFRLDPNMPFWNELKKGADHFEAAHRDVSVGVCGGHYVFGVKSADGQPLDPEASCPPLVATQPDVEALVAERERADESQVAALVKQGERPVRLVYRDGAQNPVFAGAVAEVGRPEALVPPVELALDGAKGGLARAASIAVAMKLAEDQTRAEAEGRAAAPKIAVAALTSEPGGAAAHKLGPARPPAGKLRLAARPQVVVGVSAVAKSKSKSASEPPKKLARIDTR